MILHKRTCEREGIIDLLDDNILLEILSKIEDRSDRQAWTLTCKHFLGLEARCRDRVQLLRQEFLEGILQRYSNVAHLDLSPCIRLVDDGLVLVARYAGSNLRSINLSKVVGFTGNGLAILGGHCSCLRELDISYCASLQDWHIIAISQMSSLEVLKLMGCHSISDVGLGSVAAGCKGLLVLNLRGCLGITDAGIELIAANCTHLQSLDLSYTEVTDDGLVSISVLRFLEFLSLVACNNIGDQGLKSLQNLCETLLRLDVSSCPNVSEAGITAIARGHTALQQLTLSYFSLISNDLLAAFQKFDNLQAIVLDGCEIVGNGLPFIGRGCRQLKELSLSKCRGVTDKGIIAVASGCKGLHTLNLTCCRDLTDATLACISKACRSLEVLKMEACILITENGLCYLGEGCPLLKELDLTECNMNDTGMKHISKCTALQSLKLGFCSVISDEGAAHIGARCCELRELDLYRSKGIGDTGVASIAAGCPKLKVIDISYCTKISDAALESLSQLKDLEQLDLRGCPQVSSCGLAVMASGCKRLLRLDIKNCSKIGNAGVWAVAHFCSCLKVMNLSYCAVSSTGLRSLRRLRYLQSLRVHLKNVTVECFVELLVECKSLKNVKLPAHLRPSMPSAVTEEIENRGCRIRWMPMKTS